MVCNPHAPTQDREIPRSAAGGTLKMCSLGALIVQTVSATSDVVVSAGAAAPSRLDHQHRLVVLTRLRVKVARASVATAESETGSRPVGRRLSSSRP